jgi:hypothetical protein
MKLNAARLLGIQIGGTAKAAALSPLPVKDGERPTKYRNEKRKRAPGVRKYPANGSRP